MKVIGLDIASTTGWAILEDGKLTQRGSIQIISQMELPQRLNFFYLEIKRLLEREKPEFCFIEDVILGISGAKTLAYLGRLNGVAIAAAFTVLQEKVKLYTPDYWKANSFEGLNGHAKKWQIQLAAIKHFGLSVVGNFEYIEKMISEQNDKKDQLKQELELNKKQVLDAKKLLISKRSPPTASEASTIKLSMKASEAIVLENKKQIKKCEVAFDKLMNKTSIDIAAQTGVTQDVADASGVAFCGWKLIQ